jgi:hypothetical protein
MSRVQVAVVGDVLSPKAEVARWVVSSTGGARRFRSRGARKNYCHKHLIASDCSWHASNGRAGAFQGADELQRLVRAAARRSTQSASRLAKTKLIGFARRKKVENADFPGTKIPQKSDPHDLRDHA